ncbi:hypothetical protein TNCT_708511 [Trichonephila clavata]|uniref:Uncharacterized protein n=1 Tax=Trichonephila clavata TaxID=2740835 RepID=A0A8X6KVK8_TRICU|nr:hypothetical protein TNCT_708511 [Trichonephila clavata]
MYGDFGSERKAPPVHCGTEERENKTQENPYPALWTAAEGKVKSETRTQNRRSLTQREWGCFRVLKEKV